MSKANQAASWAVNTSANPVHGYSQNNRWGPDYDCSSFVIQAYEQAGVPVKEAGATYTGNMKAAFLACGFKDVTRQVNLANGYGLELGDVLLNEQNHAAMALGNGQVVHARSSDGNSIPGDQSGNEIRVQAYYNYPWNVVLRYDGESVADEKETPDGVGQLKTDARCYELRLPYICEGSMGDAVRAVQFQLAAQGYYIGPDGADGEYGPSTEAAVKEYQRNIGLSADGIVGPDTGAKLFGAEVLTAPKAEKKEEKKQEIRPETFWNNLLSKIKK